MHVERKSYIARDRDWMSTGDFARTREYDPFAISSKGVKQNGAHLGSKISAAEDHPRRLCKRAAIVKLRSVRDTLGVQLAKPVMLPRL